MGEKLYYIQNTKVPYVGNSAVLWCENSRGYTINAECAGVYTEEEAHEICDGYEGSRMLLKSAVDKVWRRHLDGQDMHLVLDAMGVTGDERG